MSGLIDSASAVRKGEALDLSKLAACLRERLPDVEGDLRVEQFRNGHSNLTYLLHSGAHEWVLRRAPFGSKVKGAHDMGREFTVLTCLNPVYPAAPKPILYVDEPEVIGAPFYLMERVRGTILRTSKPEGLELTPTQVTQCCESFVRNLADLHALDYISVGLEALRKPGNYVERQVIGWSDRYQGSKTDDIPDIDAISDWLKTRIPVDSGATLVHNDYKFDNIVLDPNDLTRIVGVLDWEMATIGDPLADLATTLSYWTDPDEDDPLAVTRCFLTSAEGSLSRRQLAETYSSMTGRNIDNLLFYYVLALLKLAVIVQQIYYRYAKGLTQDERFAVMIEVVKILGRRAVDTIGAGKI